MFWLNILFTLKRLNMIKDEILIMLTFSCFATLFLMFRNNQIWLETGYKLSEHVLLCFVTLLKATFETVYVTIKFLVPSPTSGKTHKKSTLTCLPVATYTSMYQNIRILKCRSSLLWQMIFFFYQRKFQFF
jgi:hypothetical protein